MIIIIIYNNHAEIDNIDDCVGEHRDYTKDLFGILHAEDNKYCVQQIIDFIEGEIINEDILYISVFTSYVSSDFEENPGINIKLLQKSLKMLKSDMRKVGLWNKENFGVYTIFRD